MIWHQVANGVFYWVVICRKKNHMTKFKNGINHKVVICTFPKRFLIRGKIVYKIF